jgi:hypothetical protein
MSNSDNIFQKIWTADQQGNGIPALRPNEDKDSSRGYVVVDERATSVGSDHRVLAEVVIPPSKRKTYELCERLFDNYALERIVREQITDTESQEELDFIDAILPTPPIEVARQFLESSLDLTLSQSLMAAMIKETWFTLGASGNQPDASGFEHVFVGEQASKSSEIGGYHFWYKYHLDDAGDRLHHGTVLDDRIEYLGTQYGGADEPDKGVLVPEVVTLSLRWEAPLGDGNQGTKTLHKPIGGFFVGCSPEGLIALGLVRTRTQSSKLALINGAKYQLDLHRLDGNRNAIRTFFPRFISANVTRIIDENGNDTEGEVTISPFKVLMAMVNPENPEGGKEFLQIANISDNSASLLGWKVVAPNGVTFELADIEVLAGDIFKFIVPSNNGILRNKSGIIQLKTPNNKVAGEYSYTSEQARQEGKPIVFSV